LVLAFTACSAGTTHTAGSGGGGPGTTTGSGGKTGAGGAGGALATSSSGIVLTTVSSGTGGAVADGGCDAATVTTCQRDSDCTGGAVCILSDPNSEIPMGICTQVQCDGGPSCSMQAVDPTCSVADASVEYPPYVPLYAPDVPATCANGFEVCDAEGAPVYVIHSTSPAGSEGLTLDLDFATYVAPDGLLITGVGACNTEYVLFDSCRISTAPDAEGTYTNGMERPTDTAIRQFHLTLLPGTTQLTFDFSRVTSPMYFQILGLCDFALPPTPGVGWFSLVP
jgi:hypothetical protein